MSTKWGGSVKKGELLQVCRSSSHKRVSDTVAIASYRYLCTCTSGQVCNGQNAGTLIALDCYFGVDSEHALIE